MLEETKARTETLQRTMTDQRIEVAVFTDEASITYLAGF